MARMNPEINAGSMADIAFLLLIFFLVTTTMDVDSGIMRLLPPPPDPAAAPPPPIKERNVFVVLVNSKDMLLVEGRPGNIRTLKDDAKRFFKNPSNDPNLSEQNMKNINMLGEIRVSRGVISLQNDRGTSYDMYIKVQNELAAAINELRDQLSEEKFGQKFSKLTDSAMTNAIKTAVPMAISEAEPKDVGRKL